MNKCQRCYTRKAIFNCPSCDKYHNFCQNCDDYIHSSKKTQSHKRNYINYQNNNSLFNLTYNSNNKNQLNTFPLKNKSSSNDFSFNSFSNDYNNHKEEEKKTPSFYKFQKYYDSTDDNRNYNNTNTNTNINTNYNITNFNNNNNFSISNNNNKNKSKITGVNSIKNQIEYIQKNMSEQINQILHNIDINNQKMNYQQQLDDIEKNYQEQINKLMQSKNKEIEELETEIKEANKTNETLVNEISKANQNNNIKIIGLTNIINSLRDELNQKEEQILILKGNSKKNEINYYKDIDEEKNMICSEYEKKISNILNISENNQEKLMNVIKEKDVIIQNLINCNQNKNKEFNEFIQKINEENKQLKNLTEQSIGMSKFNLVNSMNNNDNINYNNQM